MFLVSIFGMSSTPQGRWRADRNIVAISLMGSQRLDFSDAILDEGETRVTIIQLMGSTRVEVPRGIEATVDGIAIMGSRRVAVEHDPETRSDRWLRITTLAGMGSIVVRTAGSVV